VLAGLVVLAAAVRFWRIGHQSFWLDETFTAGIVARDLGGMLDGVRDTESTPPLYYVLAWLWERAFGSGETGLRSLSALFGVATVPAAWAAARHLFSERAGLIAAALFAVNPYLVWYSQEARAYALLVLLCTLALLFAIRAQWWRWAVASALALLTHYFAVLFVGPMALWLLWRERSRALALAAAVPAAVALALLPLALSQRDAGHTLFIADISFPDRLVSFPKRLATGELGTPTPLLGVLIGAALVAGALLALRAHPRPAALLLGLAASGVAIALLLKLAGLDLFFPRNLIAAFVPVLVTVAGGYAAIRHGPLVAAALAVGGLAIAVQVSVNEHVQRADWRGVARALGPARAPRAVVVTPEVGKTALRHYAGPLPRFPYGTAVSEVVVIAEAPSPDFPPLARPRGFRLRSNRRTATWQLVRYVAPAPVPVGFHGLNGARLERGEEAIALIQRPSSTLGGP
jgi:hypothetical protein